ncbi:MAG TPA: hemerythrin domain-containing protein [Acidimicrobiales bacterium]|nr:hemerythrin domain-containing protein [Acidimicrobiales bacterium]
MDAPEDREEPVDKLASASATKESSLRDLLASYDREVRTALDEVRASDTGTQRVRSLHNSLSPAIAVHDAVLASALCPLLDDLPGGSAVADRLRQGCRERGDLLRRFEALSKGVAAHNVYPASGAEVEEILEGLAHSFEVHAQDETTEVNDLLSSVATSTDPQVIAARLAIAARSAPTRVHMPTRQHPRSSFLNRLYRDRDRVADWVDAHHGWADPGATGRSPRARQIEQLQSEAVGPASTITVRELLAGYDTTVDELIAAVRAARSDVERADAAHRFNAAITIHDSVLGGVLCPLLRSVPGGEEPAARLREGCLQRAQLQQAWNALTHRVSTEDLYALHRPEADEIIGPLIENFDHHEKEGSVEVTELLERLPADAFRTKGSPFADFMWPWHSEGAGVLALHMATWARRSPTRSHPWLVKHPTSRTLRSLYHLTDHFRDFWRENALERWLFPWTPSRPLSGKAVPRRLSR